MGPLTILFKLYLEFFLLTPDQSAGQVCAGTGQVVQSALQVAHFGEQAFSLVTQLQLKQADRTY